MYTACLWCNSPLGKNEVLPSFPVGRRFAFDARKGRLWVICPHCERWNLTPLDERWEAIEACERLFRSTRLRYSTDRIGLAQLVEGVDLVRVGDALRPELAAWRYGRTLARVAAPGAGGTARAVAVVAHAVLTVAERAERAAGKAARLTRPIGEKLLAPLRDVAPRGEDVQLWWRLHVHGEKVAHVTGAHDGERIVPAVVRYRHLAHAELVRPNDRSDPWRLDVPHDDGVLTLRGTDGLRVAGKLLASLNTRWPSGETVRLAVRKLDDAGQPDGFFHRVIGLAMRTRWGRVETPHVFPSAIVPTPASTTTEALALYITNRSFWSRGGIGSESRTPLPGINTIDRLALEMAANEDVERRALEGELAELEAAWREAEEIAAIADQLPNVRARAPFGLAPVPV
ncbi:hypothetical protein J421_0467 [Gemmatirosa kalamazoonensis]|uniref:Uncharacterized protein n=1 Tax=Gemmatirosa kalamazoonensis TaxID=861299 RepID=W0RA57_9BACT|nr:hypothetical protein [Gemmatirosa kalamazoonensis]AHG88004.1 hypothetical protein J421_0467 [Gemmatirosa kalamazoonensis]